MSSKFVFTRFKLGAITRKLNVSFWVVSSYLASAFNYSACLALSAFGSGWGGGGEVITDEGTMGVLSTA